MSINRFRVGRRRALILLGQLGILGLSSCCCLRPFPSSEIDAEPKPTDVVNPFLRPTVRAYTGKPYKYCIDAHAHFFNASDVNVKGYLEGPVAHGIRSEPLREFLKKMAPIVDDLAGSAPHASDEYRVLLDMMSAPRLLAAPLGVEALDEIISKHRDNLAEELFRRMRERNLDEFYLRLRESHMRLNQARGVIRKESFSYETVRTAIDPSLRKVYHRELFGFQAQSAETMDPSGVLEFVSHMLSYRWMTLRTYQKVYSEDDDAFGIDAVFGALVDFDYWLDCPTRSSQEDQVKVQSLLSLLSGGYMLPLVSYNPWTDIKRGDASLKLVKRAVLDYGFIGVKIYPPMGYFPYGNELNKDKIQTPTPRPDLHDLDEKLDALFTWCDQKGVPVMAHTGESMGRDDPSDEFGGPLGWAALLDKFQDKPPPLINAGHFGGDLSNPNHSENSWPKQLAELMARFSGARFYSDIGYWTALRWCGSDNEECKKAVARIEAALRAFEKTRERIMYGSDWFMLSKEPDWGTYAGQLANNLKHLLPMDRLFYRNAIECFELGTNGQNRRRISNRFTSLPGGPLSWLSDA